MRHDSFKNHVIKRNRKSPAAKSIIPMENINPNAAGEVAIAPVTPAKKRQAKKLAIIPMLDGYTPIAANPPNQNCIDHST